MMIYLFVLFYVFAISAESLSYKRQMQLLLVVCVALAFGAGFRSMTWPDTMVYVMAFLDYTPSLLDYSLSDSPFGYSEKGFYFIGVIVKTFTGDPTIYLLVVSLLTFLFLYIFLKKYAIYPFLGICVYLARFFVGRNLIQIRTGLAYAIIILGVRFITERDWKRYFTLVFIAYLFHRSAIIAVPLYFISYINFKKWHVVLIIAIAFIIGGFFTETLQNYIVETSQDLNVATTYTQSSYVHKAKGLSNPLIYMQTFLLFAYTFYEKRLKSLVPQYYTIRTGYMYSTFILIAFSMFTALSGRTSTMFATLEIIIIPSLIHIFDKKNRLIAYVILGIVLTVIMYINISNKS